MEDAPSHPARLLRDAVPLVLLLAVCAKSTFGAWQVCDLTASDETEYLVMAARPEGAERSALYVPLYVAWYRLVLLLPLGPEYLPFVNHALLQTALAVLFYLLARRLGVGRWVGVFASAVLMLHTRAAFVYPFPVHMATAFLALGALVGTYQRSLLGACGPLGFALLAACYVRNEFGTFLLAFLPVYLTVGVWVWWRTGARRAFLAWAVPLTFAVGACAATVGVPLPDGPRGLFAFGQHYARNVGETTGAGDELHNSHWRDVVTAEFGDVRTFGDAVRAKPGAVAWHVGRNLSRWPGVALELCRPKLPLSNTARTPVYLLLLAVLAVGLVGAVRRVRSGGPEGHAWRTVLLATTVAVAVSAASVVLVYPREHYLVLPLFFVFVLATAGLPAPRWPAALGAPTRAKRCAVGCAAGFLLLAAAPTAAHGGTLLDPLVRKKWEPPPLRWRETAVFLRSLPLRPGAGVLAHDPAVPFVTVWMPQPVRVVPHHMKAEGFREFAVRHDVGIVLLDERVRADARFATDPTFLALWDGRDTGPFAILTTPGGHRVAVRRDVLTAE